MSWFLRISTVLCLLLLVVFVGLWVLGPMMRTTPVSMPGYLPLMIAAEHRTSELEAHIWYPTDQSDLTDPSDDIGYELIGENALFYGIHVIPQAVPSEGLLPVVLLSHGSGGNAVALGWLASELARRGFIVAAVNHPGTTSGDSDPYQTVEIWQRPADLRALLDRLTHTAPLGLLPDLSRVAVVGFSLGGHTALALSGAQVSKEAFMAYCDENSGAFDCGWMQEAGVDFSQIDQARYEARMADDRIGVTVAIDPALPRAMTQQSLATIEHPVMVINLGELDQLPDAFRADSIAAAMPNAAYASVSGSAHFSFLAECTGLGKLVIALGSEENICSDTGLRNRGELHDELAAAIAAFLELNMFRALVPISAEIVN